MPTPNVITIEEHFWTPELSGVGHRQAGAPERLSIELPQDAKRAASRDAHSGFIAHGGASRGAKLWLRPAEAGPSPAPYATARRLRASATFPASSAARRSIWCANSTTCRQATVASVWLL